tara:strand:- start:1028 stop:1156 length:129 start_codon:yes stop_codon:yes gene_type:complete
MAMQLGNLQQFDKKFLCINLINLIDLIDYHTKNLKLSLAEKM